jgi:hypothetical protein
MPIRILKNLYLKRKVNRSKLFNIFFKKDYHFPSFGDKYHLELSLQWYLQDITSSVDGGINSKINIIDFINKKKKRISYPETSGYILSSLINSRFFSNTIKKKHIEKVLFFLLKKQNEDGGFSHPSNPTKSLAFDTGQVLGGLLTYYMFCKKNNKVKKTIFLAANFLAKNIMKDGTYCSEVLYRDQKCYYSSATMSLSRASKVFKNSLWKEKSKKNINWILSNMNRKLWFKNYSFGNGPDFNLHGIAYTIRGILEHGIIYDKKYIRLVRQIIDKIFKINFNGIILESKLPLNFFKNYKSFSQETCPTGLAQIAVIVLKLAFIYKDKKYQEIGRDLVENVKMFQIQGLSKKIDGLFTGSWPIDSNYQPYDLPNWPTKFFIDSLMLCNGLKYNRVII